MAEQPGIEQKVLGQWECTITTVVGDPTVDPEVHVYMIGGDATRQISVAGVVDAERFDPNKYAPGNKVLIEEFAGNRYRMRDTLQK